MPNWTRTTYVFYSQQKEIVKDFHDKLLRWLQEATLFPNTWDGSSSWLGNILANAGFDLKEMDEILRYRGTLEEIAGLEEGRLNTSEPDVYYYFTILTDTAWIEMPKMWVFILKKLYGAMAEEKLIDFAFIAEEETHYYVHAYNAPFLPLLGVATDEKYSCLTYIGEDFSKELAFEANQYEMTAGSVAEILSEILDRYVTASEVEDEDLLQQLLDESNAKLKAGNKDYYVEVVPIAIVSEEEFE